MSALCVLAMFAVPAVASADYRSAVMSDGPANYFRMGEAGDFFSHMLNEVPGELHGYHDNVPLKDITGALEQESPNLSVGYRESPNLDQSYFPIDFALFSYDSFSIEFFVWTGAEPLPPGVTQWYDGYGLVDGEISGVTSDAGTAIVEGGRVGFGMGSPDTTIISQKAVNDGFWHHVVATHVGGGLMRLYVDGILEAETGGGPTDPRTNKEFSVGALLTGVGQFPGLLDEVAFYRHGLNGTDVVEHYTASGRQANIPKSSSRALAEGVKSSTPGLAATIEKKLDDCVNQKSPKKEKPKKKKSCNKVKFKAPDLAPGQGAGALVTVDPNGGKLIGDRGGGLISDNGSSLISENSSAFVDKNGAPLLSDGGGGLVSDAGSGLIGDAGSGIVSDQGAGRIQLAAISAKKRKPKAKRKVYILGRYSALTDGIGTFSATFRLTKEGKRVIKVIGALNVARKAAGKKPIPLPATFGQVILPSDGSGVGGAFTSIEIK